MGCRADAMVCHGCYHGHATQNSNSVEPCPGVAAVLAAGVLLATSFVASLAVGLAVGLAVSVALGWPLSLPWDVMASPMAISVGTTVARTSLGR